MRLALLLAIAIAVTACASAPTRLTYGELKSSALRKPMQYAVYAPPGWTRAESLPLVVFLHGGGDGPDCFDRAGVGQRLDQAMESGRAPRAIVVVPQGDLGFWENWHDGTRRYRDWVVRELLPRIRGEYGTRLCPDGCHVIGISMGGHGALRFAFFEHATFSSVTSISGPIMDTQRIIELADNFLIGLFVPFDRVWGPLEDRRRIEREDLFLAWKTQADLHSIRLLLAWGTEDRGGLIASNEAFHRNLRARGIDHRTLVFEGGHEWTAWTPVIEEVLRIQLFDQGSSQRNSRSPFAGTGGWRRSGGLAVGPETSTDQPSVSLLATMSDSNRRPALSARHTK